MAAGATTCPPCGATSRIVGIGCGGLWGRGSSLDQARDPKPRTIWLCHPRDLKFFLRGASQNACWFLVGRFAISITDLELPPRCIIQIIFLRPCPRDLRTHAIHHTRRIDQQRRLVLRSVARYALSSLVSIGLSLTSTAFPSRMTASSPDSRWIETALLWARFFPFREDRPVPKYRAPSVQKPHTGIE